MILPLTALAILCLHTVAFAQEVSLMEEGKNKIFEIEAGPALERMSTGGRDGIVTLYEKGRERNEFTRRVLTRRIHVHLAPGVQAEAIARKLGLQTSPELSYLPNHYVFTVPERVSSIVAARALTGEIGVIQANPILARLRQKRFLPNDPLFPEQWTIFNTGQNGGLAGMDINVTNVWNTYRGTGITIAIVDDGLQYTHPDLSPNCDLTLGFDYRDNDSDPKPEGEAGVDDKGNPKADSHGTSVGGVAAARGNNGLGAAGVAFEATLAGVRLIGGAVGDDQEAGAIAHAKDKIQVSNNSWGGNDDAQTKGGAGPLVSAALANGTSTGRGGKGIVYVWAAGNGGEKDDNANYDTYPNSIYTIAVGALNDLGKRASYSERGSCLVISAPSGNDNSRPAGSVTTDLLGEFGSNRSDATDELADLDYTQKFNGTSSAAPVVAGVAALVLQANPNLGWRDVKEILIRSATKVDPTSAEWQVNAAGIPFNHDFGAGLVNAAAAVNLAKSWTNLRPATSAVSAKSDISAAIPDGAPAGLSQSFSLAAPILRVEHATVQVGITHPKRGELEIRLVSPSGTISRLAEKHGDTNADYDHKFMTVFNWGEKSDGEWKLEIIDSASGNAGVLNSVTLEVFGAPAESTTVERPKLVAKGFGAQGQFQIRIEGTIGASYLVEVSNDLITWRPFSTVVLTAVGLDLPDPNSNTAAIAFYRAKVAP